MAKRYKILITMLVIVLLGYVIPENVSIPVKNASVNDWNNQSFWYEPWGSSGVHKGIDIFAKKGASVLSSTGGFVLFQGELSKGGKVVLVLGPKWKLHYFAHLNSISVQTAQYLSPNQVLGSVGDSGNAKGKQAHLHYSIVTIVPHIWSITKQSQGWKKMFFLNPDAWLKGQ